MDGSDSLDGDSDDDVSDSGSSSTCSFTFRFEDSVGCVSGLGSGVLVPTGVYSKYDLFEFIAFVPIRVDSKGGQLIGMFSAQIPDFPSKFKNLFYCYSYGLTFPHSFLLMPLHQKHDPARSNGIHTLDFKTWYQEYQGNYFHPMS